MQAAPFQGQGSTVLVGVTAVQAAPSAGGVATQWRVRCLSTAYLSWGGAGVTAAGAPSAGSPVASTIGMNTGGIEVLTFPAGSFFISTVAASFELTPGEGV